MSPCGVGYMASLKKGSPNKYIQNLIKKLSGLKTIHSVDSSRIGALEFSSMFLFCHEVSEVPINHIIQGMNRDDLKHLK